MNESYTNGEIFLQSTRMFTSFAARYLPMPILAVCCCRELTIVHSFINLFHYWRNWIYLTTNTNLRSKKQKLTFFIYRVYLRYILTSQSKPRISCITNHVTNYVDLDHHFVLVPSHFVLSIFSFTVARFFFTLVCFHFSSRVFTLYLG